MHIFSFPTPIEFGPGAVNSVGPHLKAQGFKRPLVITDRGIAALPLLKTIVDSLTRSGLEVSVYSGVEGNPVMSQLGPGVKAYAGHRADCLVGLGGGAAIDVTKAVALLATHDGPFLDYEDGKPGAKPIGANVPYWVAIPTTSGTGSEVGRSTVISDDKTHAKKIVFSPHLLAKRVFADPELTIGLPAKITAATGMDALTHCIESYLAKDYHPICDGIALEGLALAAANLERCVTTPKDIEARGSMLLASMMGAIAFQKGLGLTHSCAHALSTVADFHHGLANGVMIDHALAFNAEVSKDRFRTMASRIGLADPSAPVFLRWLTDLKKRIQIPARLGEAGIRKEQLDRLAELAFQDACHPNNPRPVTAKDFSRIFEEAF